jgi:hypothetical protein
MSDDGDKAAESERGDEETPSDRRGGVRHLACFPAHLETDGGQRNALIRDLSISGALLLTRAKIGVGDVVRLSLYLKEGADPEVVSAKVVRHERRSIEMAHPWTKAVAVQFDAPLLALEGDVKALADKQAALAGRPPPSSKQG